MVDAGILLGVPRGAAMEMVTQAVFGAATMLGVARASGDPVARATSPAAPTISAIRELEKHGVRAAFLAAMRSAGTGARISRRLTAAR